MTRSGTLNKAKPGKQNAMDWLMLKIVECSVEPMDDTIAEKLSVYNSAYNALCQWDGSSDKITRYSREYEGGNGNNAKIAKEWASRMQNEDGTKGAHWNMEQAKQVMADNKIDGDPWEFWIVLCLMYSDYCKVAKKLNVNNMDFYISMAKAFLDDKDAVSDKVSAYYKNIVKK